MRTGRKFLGFSVSLLALVFVAGCAIVPLGDFSGGPANPAYMSFPAEEFIPPVSVAAFSNTTKYHVKIFCNDVLLATLGPRQQMTEEFVSGYYEFAFLVFRPRRNAAGVTSNVFIKRDVLDVYMAPGDYRFINIR